MADTGGELYQSLAALSWGLLDLDTAQHQADFTFFREVVAQNGGVALDIGCGTGRLLKSLLKAGLTVEGCDISGEMLAFCRQNLTEAGFPNVPLYETPCNPSPSRNVTTQLLFPAVRLP